MGTQDTDSQGLRGEEKTHDKVLQDEENTHFNPIKVNFEQEHPEQGIHKGQQEIEMEQVLFADAQAELLHWHYHLNHLPFKCIQNMASHDSWKEFDHHYAVGVHMAKQQENLGTQGQIQARSQEGTLRLQVIAFPWINWNHQHQA